MTYWDNDDQPELRVDRFWAVTHPRRRTLPHFKHRYRADAPKLRALVAVHLGVLQDLTHIGEEFEWLLDESGESINEYLDTDWSSLPNGIYIWEGVMKSDGGCYDYFGEWECDYWLEGDFRPATKEEWESHVNGEYPWDPDLWIASAPEVEPEKPPERIEPQSPNPLLTDSDILDDDLEPIF